MSAPNVSQSWLVAPEDLSLSSGLVDVWRTKLDLPEAWITRYCDLLSEQERQRAARFRMTAKYNEYVITRGLLRSVLARMLGGHPRQFDFSYGPHGKPDLADRSQDRTVSFNVSHTHGLALVALMPHRALGVDVEMKRENVECAGLAKRFFSGSEAGALLSLPTSQQRQAFFNCWTRKEAFIKAKGQGISLGLDEFDVTLRPGEPPRLLATCWDPQEAARWTLLDLNVGSDYAAALAVEAVEVKVRCWDAGM